MNEGFICLLTMAASSNLFNTAVTRLDSRRPSLKAQDANAGRNTCLVATKTASEESSSIDKTSSRP